MIDIKTLVKNYNEKNNKIPNFLVPLAVFMLKKLFHQNEANAVLKKIGHLESFEFIQAVLEHFKITYECDELKRYIPEKGRLIVIANHPLGAFDALSLIMLIKEIRKDVVIVANELLANFKQIQSLIIPVDNLNQKPTKEQILAIYNALKDEKVLIIFPSGEVSRVRPTGIKDTKWQSGFLKFALKSNADIIPIFIKARNSWLFYTISTINKQLATFLLPHEMFKNKNINIKFKVSELISIQTIKEIKLPQKQLLKLFKKHFYNVAKNKNPIFKTQKCIALPEDRHELLFELKASKKLGETKDGKEIYLFSPEEHSKLIKEIGRLRELTFRSVQEGTGKQRDLDEFDRYYKHIVLWDNNEQEVVGAYRIAEAKQIQAEFGHSGFYTDSLFEFQDEFDELLENAIELGRSFVAPKFWGTRALDYLWQGIGAYLRENQNIKYLFGGVSLSNSYPKMAKNLIIYYYDLYYKSDIKYAIAKNKFILQKQELEKLDSIFCKNDPVKDFKRLKDILATMNLSVPVLYKQYTDLCEKGGIRFVDYNVDKDFCDCVDSFIIVSLEKIKEEKRQRYIKL